MFHVSLETGNKRETWNNHRVVPPFKIFAVALPITLPALRAQATPNAVLVPLRPRVRPFTDTVRENIRDRYRVAGGVHVGCRIPERISAPLGLLYPACDEIIPRIAIVALLLFFCRSLNQVLFIEPPACACAVPVNSLRPQLIAVSPQFLDLDRSTLHRPEPAPTGLVAEVVGVVNRSSEETLPRALDWPAPERRPEPINPT